MDEAPCYFDVPHSTTHDLEILKTVSVQKKPRLTAVVTARADREVNGGQLFRWPPMICLKIPS